MHMIVSIFSALVLLVVICCSPAASASSVLLLSAFPGLSHWLTFEHIIRELLERGHQVTAVTNYKLRDAGPHGDRYREVLISPTYDFGASDLPVEVFYQSQSFSNPFIKMRVLWDLGLDTSRHAFESESVQRFMRLQGQRYDLVIAEQFVQESFLMFAHKYRAPIVTINTLGYTDYIDRSFGLLTPLSFVPHFMLPYGDRMDLGERLYNMALSMYDMCYRHFVYLPGQAELARRYFTDLGPLPSLAELEKNVSVILVNNHIVSSSPRPKINGMIDIAGLHIRPAKPLPPVVQTFLDESPDGVIYINFGTFMTSAGMPADTLNVFLTVFRNLSPRFRFLWKWESDRIPELPANVLVQKWLPQNDVLAHRNVKLFVSHGGIYGTQEAIYWARPLLFVPFYGDQHGNALKFERSGIGLTLRIVNVTVDDFQGKIERIVGERSFQDNANRLSAVFRDNPIDPLEESVFWIEYVIRHRGALHLKSAARDLPWYRYLLLDIILLVAGVLWIAKWMLKKTFVCLTRTVGLRRDDRKKHD